jgi:hypothetical protein
LAAACEGEDLGSGGGHDGEGGFDFRSFGGFGGLAGFIGTGAMDFGPMAVLHRGPEREDGVQRAFKKSLFEAVAPFGHHVFNGHEEPAGAACVIHRTGEGMEALFEVGGVRRLV